MLNLAARPNQTLRIEVKVTDRSMMFQDLVTFSEVRHALRIPDLCLSYAGLIKNGAPIRFACWLHGRDSQSAEALVETSPVASTLGILIQVVLQSSARSIAVIIGHRCDVLNLRSRDIQN